MAPRLDIYSLALLSAMALAGAALIATLVDRIRAHPGRSSAVVRFSVLAVGFAAFGATFHLASGHAPGTVEALSGWGFVDAHRALVATLLLACGLFALARRQGSGRGR